MPRSTIRISEDIAERLDAVAALRGESVNAVVNNAIREYLASHRGIVDDPRVGELLDAFMARLVDRARDPAPVAASALSSSPATPHPVRWRAA